MEYTYKIIRTGDMEVNTVILMCNQTKSAAIIDPGDDAKKIEALLEEMKARPEKILLTHGHFDHFGAADELRKKYSIEIYCHESEVEMLKSPIKNASIISGKMMKLIPDKFLEDKDLVDIGKIQLKVLHTPGHTKGGLSFYISPVVISGDCLFDGTIGRTDLHGSDTNELIASIRQKLFDLPDDTVVVPGHGPLTKISKEKLYNRFLQS